MSNSISFTGRLTRDAEKKTTPNGVALITFSAASDVGYGDKKVTNWFNCQIWGKKAEGKLAEYLAKGVMVFVIGEFTLRQWANKEGVKQISPDVNILSIDMLSKRTDSGGDAANNTVTDDDVAF